MTEDLDLLAAIARHAVKVPDRVAAFDDRRSISYQELMSASEQVAADLASGTQAWHQPVAIAAVRSVEFLVGALGILRAGHAVFPVDHSLPRGHLALMHQRARPVARIDVSGARPRVDWSGLDAVSDSSDSPGGRYGRHSQAYVLFTSGSTGEPKGVAMPRRPLEHLVEWHRNHDDLPAAAVTTQLAPLTFDVSWQEILSTLATGGSLAIPAEDVRRDPQKLVRYLRENKVSRMFLATALLDPVARHARTEAPLVDLRAVYVAGSQLRITNAIRSYFATIPTCALYNHYGPTETHVVTSNRLDGPATGWPDLPAIGTPLGHVRTRLRDVSSDGVGELLLGGDCLADGYISRPDLDAERFTDDVDGRWYATGDLVRVGEDSVLHYLGRADRMVKIDGFRVEPGEIEAHLARRPDVSAAHVSAHDDGDGIVRLVAYVVVEQAGRGTSRSLREHVASSLPVWMVPAEVVCVEQLPLTPNGKVDESALARLRSVRPELGVEFAAPRGRTESLLCSIWRDVLGLQRVGRDDAFFDLGGTSLALLRVAARVRESLDQDFPLADFYAYPSPATFAAHVDGLVEAGADVDDRAVVGRSRPEAFEPIAIVGMSCRFPGASDPGTFWANLDGNSDFISRGTADGVAAGLGLAAGLLEDIDCFDAALFGLSPHEAENMDPQQRKFLECAWEALEDAGVQPTAAASVGVFGGSGPSTYLVNNVRPSLGAKVGPASFVSSDLAAALLMATSTDFLTNRASYLLDLRGPSLNVNSACSTSLTAVHLACQSLRNGESDVVLAGAASIQVPQMLPYEVGTALPLSPDGVCRVFDIRSDGTVFGSGVGVVVLKRLSDSLSDGDDIYAVIRGTGVSNDGAQKVGMTAPSVGGQVSAARQAIDMAGVDPRSVTYIEAHGTGTIAGDPIEVAALGQAYGRPSGTTQRLLGSVKPHVGHLGWASGMAGLIKCAYSLHRGRVPRTINFEAPNPELQLDVLGFRVLDDEEGMLLGPEDRVAVNSVGLGGSNAHAILEAPPVRVQTVEAAEESAPWSVLPLSARTPDQLTEVRRALAEHITEHAVEREDLVRTLSLGRRHLGRRSAVVLDPGVHTAHLKTVLLEDTPYAATDHRGRPLIGLFPGHGRETTGMARELYEAESAFRHVIDSLGAAAKEQLGATVGDLLYSAAPGKRITDPGEVHAVTFATQVALHALVCSKGLVPDILLGHSLGQYAAAACAGVFDPETGLRIAVERGLALADTSPTGTMFSLSVGEDTVVALIGESQLPVDLAVVNGPSSCVVAGERAHLQELAALASSQGIRWRDLGSLRAGHSRLVAIAADRLVRVLSESRLSAPTSVLISNLDGAVAGAEVADPEYWGRHLVETVRFRESIATLRDLDPGAVIQLGVSPGVLGTVATQLGEHPGPFLPLLLEDRDSRATLAQAVAQCFEVGYDVRWSEMATSGRIVHLPTYPFARDRHWVGPSPATPLGPQALVHRVEWVRTEGPLPSRRGDLAVVGLAGRLRDRVEVALGTSGADEHLGIAAGPDAGCVICVDPREGPRRDGQEEVARVRAMVMDVLNAVRLMDEASLRAHLSVITWHGAAVDENEIVDPGAAAVGAMLRSLRLERPDLRATWIDVGDGRWEEGLSAALVDDAEIALRHGQVHVARLRRATPSMTGGTSRVSGTHVILGGGGGIGRLIVSDLLQQGGQRILVGGRTAPPEGCLAVPRTESGDGPVEFRQVDVTDADSVRDFMAEAVAAEGTVARIVLCTGHREDAMSWNVGEGVLERVLGPKVGGALNVLEACRSLGITAPVQMFSSATAAHGNLGQTAYGAANGYLDGLAQQRVALGETAVSLGWGVWGDVGQVSVETDLLEELGRRGFGSLSSTNGLDLLRRATHEQWVGSWAVLPNDWPRFLASHDVAGQSLFADLRDSLEKPEAPEQANPPLEPVLRRQLRSMVGDESRLPALTEAIRVAAARYLPDGIRPPADVSLVEVGIDSLSLVQLRNDLQTALGTSLPASLVARFGSPAGIADHLLNSVLDLDRRGEDDFGEWPAVPEDDSDREVLQLSFEQERWLSLVTKAGYGRRVVPVLVHDLLDAKAFKDALRTVVEAHDVLRTFFPEGEEPVLLAATNLIPEDLVLDLRGQAEANIPERMAESLAVTLESVPDPREAPSWNIRVVVVSDELFVVLLASEHLQFDGSGLSVFVEDLRDAYLAAKTGRNLPETFSTPYREYVRDQEVYQGAGLMHDREVMRALFCSVSETTVLDGHDLSITVAHLARRHTPEHPLCSWQELIESATRHGVSPFSLILGSYAQLAARITGQPTVCISMIRSHRSRRDLARTIGPFTSPFPVPVTVSKNLGAEFLLQVNAVLDTIANRPMYPSVDLRECVRPFEDLPLDTYFSDFGINFTHYRKVAPSKEPRIDVLEVIGKVDDPLFAGYDFGGLRRVPGLHLVVVVDGDDVEVNYWWQEGRMTEQQVIAWAREHREYTSRLLRL